MNAANFSIRNSRYHLLDKNLGQLWPSLNTFCSKLFKSRINIGKLHESTKTSKTIRKKKPPWNILFFGSDAFSLETLKKLIDNMNTSPTPTVQSVEVVCKTTQCLVNNFSEENHLKLYSWPIAVMKNKYDLGVVVSFGCLIPGKIIRMFPHGILNVHASLLPRWRGAAPIIHTILNGDTVTGVSVMKIRPKQFDIGSILNTKSVPVPQACTSMQLQTLLATEAAELLLHTLSQIPFHEDQEKEQEQANVTYAHKPTKEMMYINWAEQTCDMIDRQYRAFHERVYLKTIWDCKVVKLLDMVDNETAKEYHVNLLLKQKLSVNSSDDVHPGTVLHYKKANCLMIKCVNGWVAFRRIIKGKTMTAQEFQNGFLCKVPANKICKFDSQKNYLYDDIYNKKRTIRS